jgi:hypothetical protein
MYNLVQTLKETDENYIKLNAYPAAGPNDTTPTWYDPPR